MWYHYCILVCVYVPSVDCFFHISVFVFRNGQQTEQSFEKEKFLCMYMCTVSLLSPVNSDSRLVEKYLHSRVAEQTEMKDKIEKHLRNKFVAELKDGGRGKMYSCSE